MWALVHVSRRAQCCTSVGCRLVVVCELIENGINSSRHMCFGTVKEVPLSWWFRFWKLCHCPVVLEMGISHLLQEYWCQSMRHLQLCFVGAGNLLNSDFKGMNNAEREKLKRSYHSLIRCCTHMQLWLISSKTMILEIPWLFLSKFQLHFHFCCSTTAFFRLHAYASVQMARSLLTW